MALIRHLNPNEALIRHLNPNKALIRHLNTIANQTLNPQPPISTHSDSHTFSGQPSASATLIFRSNTLSYTLSSTLSSTPNPPARRPLSLCRFLPCLLSLTLSYMHPLPLASATAPPRLSLSLPLLSRTQSHTLTHSLKRTLHGASNTLSYRAKKSKLFTR